MSRRARAAGPPQGSRTAARGWLASVPDVPPAVPLRVLHVLNYGWPWVDGYTVRSRGLLTAQREVLGLDTVVAVSPYPAFARAQDPALVTSAWGPEQVAVPHREGPVGARLPRGVAGLQRPALGLSPAAHPAFVRGLVDVASEVDPDVVHGHHPAYVARASRDAARLLGLPFVYEVRCFNGDYDLDRRSPWVVARGRRQNALEEALCRDADEVVTIADGLARRVVAAGVDPGRVTVVRNAVDLGRFRPRAAQQPFQRDGVLRVGYATTFEAVEGLDTLVEAAGLAAPRLRAEGRRLEVVLAGTGRDAERIAREVSGRGLEDVVALPGFVPVGQMPALYDSLDLFVVPRRSAAVSVDTTPLKPLEALATGVPVLCSDLPALRELLGGRDGVRFVQAQAAPLADALLAFAEEPWTPAVAPDLSDRSWDAEVVRYREVYDRALRRRRPARAA